MSDYEPDFFDPNFNADDFREYARKYTDPASVSAFHSANAHLLAQDLSKKIDVVIEAFSQNKIDVEEIKQTVYWNSRMIIVVIAILISVFGWKVL